MNYVSNVSVQFNSVAQLCPTLCNPMDCSTPGLPVHHQLPEFTSTHVHWVGDAIQPSHPLSSPSHPTLSLSQHQGLFHLVTSSHQVANVLKFQLQPQSFQWMFRADFIQDGLVWFPCCPRDSQQSSPTPQFKSINSSALSFLYSPILTSIHDYWKTMALNRWTFVGKVMSLLFNMLSRLLIAFLPRNNHLLISWLPSPSAVIFGAQKNKVSHFSIASPTICHEVIGPDAMILVFWMLSFKPTFSLSFFTFIQRFFSSSLLSAIRVMSSAYLRLLIFLLAILIPACASSSPVFLMMYSVYKLNNQGDNIQPWLTPFLIWNQSAVPCPVLNAASWPAYRFLRMQVRWSGIPMSFRIFHSLSWSTQSKALA